jgi:hypothetical protein
MPQKVPHPPEPIYPKKDWSHFDLYERVRKAIYALPAYFKTETFISGIPGTDIFNLGATFGASIEDQLVATLNNMRLIWDPREEYKLYSFSRQGQTFPDALLCNRENGQSIIMGIELKAWYLLAKEGEPNYRFKITEDACSDWDLIVVVPWALSNVLSGAPIVFSPYVESAKYAARYRNYFWEHVRQSKSSTEIQKPKGAKPYPRKSDQVSDHPNSDSGGNFGRIARTGIMDAYVKQGMGLRLSGIEARHWIEFFKKFHQESETHLPAV